MNNKKKLWSEKAPCLKFRDPKPGEFGFNHCIGSVFYIEPSFEEKPISWFLGLDEYSSQAMWQTSFPSSGTADYFSTYFTYLYGPSSYSDGTFPLDDISLDLKKLDFDSTYKDQNFRGSRWMRSSVFSENELRKGIKYLLVTSKLKTEDFISEIKDSLLVRTTGEFKSFINTMAQMRYQSNSFAKQKKVCAEFMKNAKFRSINLLEEAIEEYWISNRTNEGIKAVDLCSLEDDELLQLYTSHVFNNSTRDLNVRPFEIDERYVKQIAINDISNGITSNSKVYLGKICKDAKGGLIKELVIQVINPSSQKALFKVSFNHDFSVFDIYAVNTVEYQEQSGGYSYARTASTLKGDSDLSLKILDELAVDFSSQISEDYKELPGYISGFKSENIDRFFEVLTRGAIDLKMAPFPYGKDNLNSWESTLKKSVGITRDRTNAISIYPISQCNFGSYTHNDLTDLEEHLNKICIDTPSLSFRRTTSGSLEERREAIANKISFIYDKLESFLIYTLKYSLGSPSIDRPYILIDKNERTIRANTEANYYVSSWHLEHCTKAMETSSVTNNITFSPKYFLKIIRLYGEIGCFSKMTSAIFDEIENQRNSRKGFWDWAQDSGEISLETGNQGANKTWHYPSNSSSGFSMMKHYEWELGNVVLSRLLKANNIDFDPSVNPAFTYRPENDVCFDLAELTKSADNLKSVFQLLMATALELSIENDTFINFSDRVKLLTSKDILTHFMSSEHHHVGPKNALKSIYAS